MEQTSGESFLPRFLFSQASFVFQLGLSSENNHFMRVCWQWAMSNLWSWFSSAVMFATRLPEPSWFLPHAGWDKMHLCSCRKFAYSRLHPLCSSLTVMEIPTRLSSANQSRSIESAQLVHTVYPIKYGFTELVRFPAVCITCYVKWHKNNSFSAIFSVMEELVLGSCECCQVAFITSNIPICPVLWERNMSQC